jgi:uncharacterized protein (DUF697 family)
MLRTNVDKLVKISVVGEVASPVYGKGVYNISAEGVPMVLPGVGGITYNVESWRFSVWLGSRPCGAWRKHRK